MANQYAIYGGFFQSETYATLEEAKDAVVKLLNVNPQAEYTIFQNLGTYKGSVIVAELGDTAAADKATK